MLRPGKPYPLGAHLTPQGVNFAIYSAHAQRIELCLFDTDGHQQSYELPARSGDIWHGLLPGGHAGLEYTYRVYGPWQPEKGLRFNPAKMVLDPYARALSHALPADDRLCGGLSDPDWRDNRDLLPRCIVNDEQYAWREDAPPNTPWGSTVIYEAHVRGLTRQHPGIPPDLRGSYAALAHPIMLEHYARLGITALELLPIQLHADEPRLQRLGLSNYWGYNVLAPFAIEPRYHSGRPGTTPLSEFCAAVNALHRAGIEVILDVVFNHTAELDERGPMVSLRGIDNRSYYWRNGQGALENWSGCGNTLRLTKTHSVQWVMDCLRYWVETCHVDGFRFDLGTVLGRTPDFVRHSPLFVAIAQDPLLTRVKFIAEPWDIGPNGYQLGHFPQYFAEWNDRFRDDMRRFWLQSDLPNGLFATRFAASSDLFRHHGRTPSSSINHITCHDGFTLRDLLSYSQRHNQANGENNRDGNTHNYSHNHGVEGIDAEDEIHARRQASARALLTTLLLAQGTPMLLAGDELGHSQQGNNNAYCQDNPIAWLDWSQADEGLLQFTAQLIHLRRRIAALTDNRWWNENDGSVRWLNADAQPMTEAQWQAVPPVALQILLAEQWLLVINGGPQAQAIVLPPGDWHIPPPFAVLREDMQGGCQHLAARSCCLFMRI
ncbi:glycogen debranching protein GlgX [Edwardsiella piscicida]|nr:glycogen debranching protein GlgX [Edwardsiella piscicida]ARD18498.1 glycogen debranching enzyme [Edwardsiella piscicida]ELM3736725.1 glycogen debranching protein GlgX [Edwardsiella piscicida]MDM3866022.1 glycogen debranching protein GlgX [Edwardsiella piscicida]QHR95499.1 glycogen debranching protein GlgX [Edwardsiella piscicida]UCQ14522.1 glycogen debranching protein GlgX [Edwardsiella piscicida]